jgi:hypothetical protein
MIAQPGARTEAMSGESGAEPPILVCRKRGAMLQLLRQFLGQAIDDITTYGVEAGT